ncbi:hypothetical protein PQX77_013720 [Marasmius sp. AFHP31]|nr:hypothetical protein PQX77_013720 [Marasmius sp. AFHP31]
MVTRSLLFSLAFLLSTVPSLASRRPDLIAELNNAGVASYGAGSQEYQEAGVSFNHRYKFQPAAIAFPRNPEQVSSAVKIGAERGVKVVAKSGGHSYIANGLGGQSGSLVLDLSKMKSITYDSATHKAVVQTGNRLGDVALALEGGGRGRGIPHGTCPSVGIGGHAAFGGFGHASRIWGLTLDAIESLEVVLANGTITHACRSSHSELFWAMRGAAPSFGITTSITFKTYPIPNEAYLTRVVTTLQAFVTSSESNIPPELSLYLSLGKPKEGRVYAEITGGWYGSQDAFDNLFDPFLRGLQSEEGVHVPPPEKRRFDGDGTYIGALKANAYRGSLDTTKPEPGKPFYAKSLTVPESEPLEQRAVMAFAEYLAEEGNSLDVSEGLNWFILFELFGGVNSRINAVPIEDTAFARRDTLWTIQLYVYSTSNTDFSERGFGFLDGAVNKIVRHMPAGWGYGAYMNYVDDRLGGESSVDEEKQFRMYYGTHYPRLQALKREVDPGNVFKFPKSVNL